MCRNAISGLTILIAAVVALAEKCTVGEEVEPPLEIVVPALGEELPLPTGEGEPLPVLPPRTVDGERLRPGMFVVEAPLYPRVRVKDAHDIHPQAVPVVVAVMDPNRVRRAQGSLVFVKVFVPPYAPRTVKVSHDEIEFDWGRYEVDVESDNGIVEIDYDD